MNLSHKLLNADPVVVAVMVILLGMSVLSWAVIFWKGLQIKNERRIIRDFMASQNQTNWSQPLDQIVTKGSIQTLLQDAQRIRRHAASYNPVQFKEVLTLHFSQSLDVIRVWLDKRLTMLATIGTSAPFIGLFGTVWGVYIALVSIAAERSAGLDVVAGPMGEALVATAAGLFAAIPAVVAYNTFIRLNRLLVQDLRHIAEHYVMYEPFAVASYNVQAPVGVVEQQQMFRSA